MAFLYQPPRLPYSGTELGLGSNVFCKKILSANILDGGPGTSLTASAPATATITGKWVTAGLANGQTYATEVTFSSTTGTGTGMKAKFSFAYAGEVDDDGIALSAEVTNPGSGYVSGEVVTWDAADILAKFKLGTNPPTLSTAYTSVDSAYTLTLGAGSTSTSAVIYTEAGSSGWQFTLGGVSGQVQLVTIIISDDGIAGNDYADSDYVVVTNITGGVAETEISTAGIASASIFHNTDNKTEQITLRRSVGDRGSGTDATLAAADVTVRLSRRQLQQ